MTAKTPADEPRVVEPERVHGRADGPRMARKRIGARVPRMSEAPYPGKSIATSLKSSPSGPSSCREKAREDEEFP